MVKVNVEPDCGNAPKKLFLRNFMIAFANNDVSSILASVADDAAWDVIGSTTVNGKTQIEALLKKLTDKNLIEMTISTIITHGDAGSVNGETMSKGGKSQRFCHICTFNSHGKNAKLKQITSYII